MSLLGAILSGAAIALGIALQVSRDSDGWETILGGVSLVLGVVLGASLLIG